MFAGAGGGDSGPTGWKCGSGSRLTLEPTHRWPLYVEPGGQTGPTGRFTSSVSAALASLESTFLGQLMPKVKQMLMPPLPGARKLLPRGLAAEVEDEIVVVEVVFDFGTGDAKVVPAKRLSRETKVTFMVVKVQ